MGPPFPFPLAALPSRSLSHTCCAVTPRQLCCSLCCAGALTLFQSLSQLPSLFLSVVIFSLLKWIRCLCCLGLPWRQFAPQICAVQEEELPEQQDNSMATSGATKLRAAPRYKRTVSKITAQKRWWTQCFWSLGEQLFQGQHWDLCFLGRPWEDLGTHEPATQLGFKAFSAKSLWESPKEGELLPLLLQLASQFPQNVQRYHLTTVLQLPPYLQRRKSPGKAAAPQHGNAELMVKTLLSEPAPCLSLQPPESFDKLPIQDSICPFIF